MPDGLSSYAFAGLSIIGALQSVYAMQLAAQNLIGRNEGVRIRFTRRIGLALLAGSFAWSAAYGWTNAWQPWPPVIVLAAGVDLLLTAAIITGRQRAAATGLKPRA